MTPNTGVKTLLLTCIVFLIWLCYFIANTGKASTEVSEEDMAMRMLIESSAKARRIVAPPSTNQVKVKFLNSEIDERAQDLTLSPNDIQKILTSINSSNQEQHVYNSDKFGAVITKDTFVIVIQVHYRPAYLNLLIQSLASTIGAMKTNDSLVIFSHDIYSEEMNFEIQQSINFTRVVQIFFPSSHQLNPTSTAVGGAKDIISTGNLKVGSRPWTKAHWWWKINFVFDSLHILKEFEGFVHFLEEDDYVTPDYVHVMKKLENIVKQNYCFGCNSLIAGHKFYGEDIVSMWQNMSDTHDGAIITGLQDHIVNRGLGFNRTVWKEVKNCEKSFHQGDVDWDWAFMRINKGCLKTKLIVMAPEAPRLIHIGNCGMSFSATVCNPSEIVEIIKNTIVQHVSLLFPNDIYISLKFVYWRGLGGIGYTGNK